MSLQAKVRYVLLTGFVFLVLSGCRTPGTTTADANAVREPETIRVRPAPPAAAEINAPETQKPETFNDCVTKSAAELTAGLAPGTIMGIIKISSVNADEAEYAEEFLIYVLVNGRYHVVERKDLDVIRDEQSFQLSGDVDDETAVSIGKMAGAEVVITGAILQYGAERRLNLRALDVETGRIRAASSRAFSPEEL